MGKTIFNMSVSLDGFVARPDGDVGQLFKWYHSGDTEVTLPGPELVFKVSRASAELFRKTWPAVGAVVTGRRNFEYAHGWDGKPPGGVPHFVVTHTVPAQWAQPGSPFTFVTDGIESAVRQAQAAGGGKDIAISTANVMQQCLRAGLLDELHVDLVPVLLGEGIRLFEQGGPAPVELEIIHVIEGAGVTHLAYRVVK